MRAVKVAVALALCHLLSVSGQWALAGPASLSPASIPVDPVIKTASTSPVQDARAYRAELERLQGEYGAYSPQLMENYLGLGLALQKQGQHEDALKSLHQAMHIKRIQGGLYTLEIEPLVEHMLPSYAAMKDWQGLDAQIHRLTQVLAAESTEVQLANIDLFERAVRWHLYSYARQLGPWAFANLNTARNLSDYAIVLLQKQPRRHLEKLMSFHEYRMRVVYEQGMLAKEEEDEIRKERFQSGYQQNFAELRSAGNSNNFYRAGRLSLLAAIQLADADEGASLQQRLEARAQLADWHQLYERYGAARTAYVEVWQQLQAQEDETERARLYSAVFERPIALHAQKLEQDMLGQRLASGFVDMEVGISRRGRIERSRTVQALPDSVNKIRKAQRNLRAMRFRPRVVDGQLTRALDVPYRHEYLYAVNKSDPAGGEAGKSIDTAADSAEQAVSEPQQTEQGDAE
jgi:hypothetical protein